ncbi:18150_t:CDS:1, partial [Cetraspora pellucida]
MPELMDIILCNLDGDSNSLYSCALVNRHWCKISIPILWRDPFSFKQNPTYISKYLSYLDDDDKLCLKEFKISILDDFPSSLFHYAKFLRVLDLSFLESKVRQWITFQNITLQRYSANAIISTLLLKLFIECGVSLSKFHIMISKSVIKPEIFYFLGQNVRFFSQLQFVSVDTGYEDFYADENIAFLKILAKNSTKIRSLQFNMHDVGYNVTPLCHALANIIKSQCQLTEFVLTGMDLNVQDIIFALATQKTSLREFKIDYCYDNGINFNALLKFEKLETL